MSLTGAQQKNTVEQFFPAGFKPYLDSRQDHWYIHQISLICLFVPFFISPACGLCESACSLCTVQYTFSFYACGMSSLNTLGLPKLSAHLNQGLKHSYSLWSMSYLTIYLPAFVLILILLLLVTHSLFSHLVMLQPNAKLVKDIFSPHQSTPITQQ